MNGIWNIVGFITITYSEKGFNHVQSVELRLVQLFTVYVPMLILFPRYNCICE